MIGLDELLSIHSYHPYNNDNNNDNGNNDNGNNDNGNNNDSNTNSDTFINQKLQSILLSAMFFNRSNIFSHFTS